MADEKKNLSDKYEEAAWRKKSKILKRMVPDMVPDAINKEDGFLVQTLFAIFYVLERISVFYWVREIPEILREKKKDSKEKLFVKTYIFPEIWAVGNVVLAIVASRIIENIDCRAVWYFFLVYATLRIFEMIVYQVNVMFFHRLNETYLKSAKGKVKSKKTEEYAIKSATRTVILLIINMVEYVLQFAVIFSAIYMIFGGTVGHLGIIESFELFMSMSDLEEYSQNGWLTVAYAETVIGMFFNLLCLARFVGLLPEVKEKGERTE